MDKPLPEIKRQRIWLAVILSLLALAVILASFFFLSSQVRSRLRESTRQRLLDITRLAALQVDAEALAGLAGPGQETTPEYSSLLSSLEKIVESGDSLTLVAALQDSSGQVSRVASVERAASGAQVIDSLEITPELSARLKNLASPYVEMNFERGQDGAWLAAYSPVVKPTDEKVGLLTLRLDVTEVLAQERRFQTFLVVVFCLIVPVLAVLGWLVGSRLYAPLLELSDASERFIEGDQSARVRVFGSPEIRRVSWTFNWMAAQLQNARNNEQEETVWKADGREQSADTVQLALSVAAAADPGRSQVEMEREMLTVLLKAFQLDFAGLYRADETGEWAVLSSRTEASEILNRAPHLHDMLQKPEQRIRIGEGLVGQSLSHGQVRTEEMALPTEETLENGDEENSSTKIARAAIPLQARGRSFGVLLLTSAAREVFKDEQLENLHILADFLALMLTNAGHPVRDRKMPSTIRPAANRENAREEEGLSGTRPAVIFRADKHGITALPGGNEGAHPNYQGDQPGLRLPIQLRGRTIGSLDLQKIPGAGEFTPEEQEVLSKLVEQMSAALESARLYEETQRRAERERLAGEIIGKIRAENQPDTILRVATEELRRALKASRTQVHLHPSLPEDGSEQPQGPYDEVANPRGEI